MRAKNFHRLFSNRFSVHAGGVMTQDIASVVGWAAGFPGSNPIWGCHRAARPGASQGAVFDRYEAWLNGQCDHLRPAYMFCEDQYLASGHGSKVNRLTIERLLGMRAICAMVCHRREIRLRWVPISTLRRFFVGAVAKGGKKAATIAMCRQYGFAVESDDEADAVSLWCYAEAELSPTASRHRSAGKLFANKGN
jgi:hypothetical protein